MPQRIPARIQLKPAQEKALAAIRGNGPGELTRDRYQQLTGMSRSQAAYDLADLVGAGILARVGGGRSTRYRLVERSDPTQRRWTSERIREELDRFCAGRKTWPSAREFKRSGRTDLYVAASRYGGIRFWAAELGLPPGPPAAIQLPRFGRARGISWAAAGAATGAVLVGTAVAVVGGWPSGRDAAPPMRVTVPERAGAAARQAGASRVRSRKPAANVARGQAPRARTVVRRQERARAAKNETGTTTSAVKVRSQPAKVQPPPPAEPTERVALARDTAASGPAPIAAPRGPSGAPPPLPAP